MGKMISDDARHELVSVIGSPPLCVHPRREDVEAQSRDRQAGIGTTGAVKQRRRHAPKPPG
jgi:hypothetical protein